jgi:aminocarboxymuconate-semialdehyde decarboxylase
VGENCRVDFHTHVVVDLPDFAQRFGDQRWPSFVSQKDVGRLTRNGQVVRSVAPSAWLPQRRIDDMDAAGVDRQVLSLIPPLICDFGDPAQAVEWTTHLNGAVAALVAENPNRFSGLGTVPLHHPDRAIQVLQRVHDDGLTGVEIGTSAGLRELDHPDVRGVVLSTNTIALEGFRLKGTVTRAARSRLKAWVAPVIAELIARDRITGGALCGS